MSAPNSGPDAPDRDATSTDSSAASSSTGLTFPQIAASALAAATAAILGSFLGVLGTIGGAAAASIVSTVGAALYQRSLERTRDRMKERLVVGGTAQDKVSAVVARATGRATAIAPTRNDHDTRVPLHQRPPAAPAARPGGRPELMSPGPRRPAGPPPGGRPPGRPAPGGPPGRPDAPGQVAQGQIAQRADGTRVMADGTRVLPDGTRVLADGVTRVHPAMGPTQQIPSSRPPMTPPGGGSTAVFGSPGGPGGPDDVTRVTPLEPAPKPKRSRRKAYVAMAGLAASVFAIGILASFGVETAAGRPLSGGSSGTSVGSLFGQDTGTAEASTAPAESDTPADPATTESSAPADGEAEQDPTSTTRAPASTSERQLVPSRLLPGGSDSGGGATNG